MQWKETFRNNDRQANIMAGRALLVEFAVLVLVWALNVMNLFIVEQSVMNRVLLIHISLLLFPYILVNRLQYDAEWVKYLIVTCAILSSGVLYTYLTFHVILMFLSPIILSSLYFDKHLVVYTTVMSTVAIIVSHILSAYVLAIPEEPFISINKIVIYGMLPRLMEFLCFSVLVFMLTNRTSNLFGRVFRYTAELKRNKQGLAVLLQHNTTLFSARQYADIAMQSMMTLNSLLHEIEPEEKCNNDGIVGVRIRDVYYCISKELVPIVHDRIDEVHRITVNDEIFLLPEEPNVENQFELTAGYMKMFFYEEEKLRFFIVWKQPFDPEDETLKNLLSIFYNNIQQALSNHKLSSDMFHTQEELVRAFAEVSESKSQQTGQHIKRVSEYMRVIGNAIGLDEEENNNLALASMMHDIGKLLVPDEILEKKGKLTDEEFATIKQHVEWGYKLLANSPGRVMQLARDIALQHHEKWNGKGYLGKKGEEIDFYSRIMAVVDVFDALVSKRSYKEAWSVQDAYDEIVKCSGTHFDPAIVALFQESFSDILKVYEKYPDQLEIAC